VVLSSCDDAHTPLQSRCKVMRPHENGCGHRATTNGLAPPPLDINAASGDEDAPGPELTRLSAPDKRPLGAVWAALSTATLSPVRA
jgi:hypothetical protein